MLALDPVLSPLAIAAPQRHLPVRAALIVAAIGLLLYLPGLGASDFLGDDEVLDAGITREMVAGGEWFFPEFNGEPIPKPPLFYWSAALTALAAGKVSESTMRLPSALFAAGTIAATVLGGAVLVGEAPALLAGALLAVMPVFWDQARLGRSDMTMTFLVTAALMLVLTRPEDLRGWRRMAFFALVGLVALAKGAAGLGLIASVLAAEAFFGSRWRLVRAMLHPTALIAVAVGSSWFVLGVVQGGHGFVERLLFGENLRHLVGGGFVGTPESGRGWLYHLTHLRNILTGTLPWGLALPAALIVAHRLPPGPRRDGALRVERWLLAGLLFFTVALRKSPYYLLPLFPAAALLVSVWISERTARLEMGIVEMFSARSLTMAAALAALLAMTVLGIRAAGVELAEIDAALAAMRSEWLLPVTMLLSLVVVVAGVRSLTAGIWRTAVPRIWLATFLVLAIAQRIEPRLAAGSSMRPFADRVRLEVGSEGEVYFFAKPARAVAFYAHRPIATLGAEDPPPRPPFWLIVRGPFWDDLPSSWRARAHIVAVGEGRVVTRSRMKIYLLEIGPHRHDDETA